MSCQKCLDLQKKLDERNEATKCWIQSDTQCRAYANKLESKLARAEAEMAEMRWALEDIEKYAGHVTRCEPNSNCRGGCDQVRKAEQALSSSGGKKALAVIQAARGLRDHGEDQKNGTHAQILWKALKDWEAGI